MSFLNAAAKQVFCKVAVHGPGATRAVEALAGLPGLYSPDDPGFRVVELAVGGEAIGPYALRLCVYALDGSDDLHALLAGADGIAAIAGDPAAAPANLAAIAPYVNEQVAVVLAYPPHVRPGALPSKYPEIAADPSSIDGARALLRALLPRISEVARARWVRR